MAWVTVRVDDAQFLINDGQYSPVETADYSNGLVVTMSNGASISTGIHTGYVRVDAHPTMEAPHHSTLGKWEEVVEASIYTSTGNLKVSSLYSFPNQEASERLPKLSLAGPGWYRLRAHACGRDIAHDDVSRDPVEQYFLTIWPSPQRPTTILRATDKCGQSLRASAAKRHDSIPTIRTSSYTTPTSTQRRDFLDQKLQRRRRKSQAE
jgi:hypothetical protein